jgi:hypothetical protein
MSHLIAPRRSHKDIRGKKHEARISINRFLHIHVMKKKRRSTHAEGLDDSEDYIALERVMALDVFCRKLDSLMMITCCRY